MPGINETVTVVKNATTQDIINTLHKCVQEAKRQTANIAKDFKGDNYYDTAENIWNFLRHNIDYVADGFKFQDIRLPGKFIRSNSGDCKSFSLFTVGILANLGMPIIIRYVSYDNSPVPSHVYVITKDENGNQIIIDGVYNKFNAEAPYTYKRDYNMDVRVLGNISQKEKQAAKINALMQRIDQLHQGDPERDDLISEYKTLCRQYNKSVTGTSNDNASLINKIQKHLLEVEEQIQDTPEGIDTTKLQQEYVEGILLIQKLSPKAIGATPPTGVVTVPVLLDPINGGTTVTGKVVTPATTGFTAEEMAILADGYNIYMYCSQFPVNKFNCFTWVNAQGVAWQGGDSNAIFILAYNNLFNAGMVPVNPAVAAEIAAGGPQPDRGGFVNTLDTVASAAGSVANKFLKNAVPGLLNSTTGTAPAAAGYVPPPPPPASGVGFNLSSKTMLLICAGLVLLVVVSHHK